MIKKEKKQLKKSKEESGKIKKKQKLNIPAASGKFLTLNRCIIINVSFFFFFLELKKKKITKRKLLDELNATHNSNHSSSDTDTDILQIYDDNSDDGTEICLICEERGKDKVWYRCTNCGFLVHAECSDADSLTKYICDICNRRLRMSR